MDARRIRIHSTPFRTCKSVSWAFATSSAPPASASWQILAASSVRSMYASSIDAFSTRRQCVCRAGQTFRVRRNELESKRWVSIVEARGKHSRQFWPPLCSESKIVNIYACIVVDDSKAATGGIVPTTLIQIFCFTPESGGKLCYPTVEGLSGEAAL